LGVIPASREVVVEDFINYHRHEIGRPKAGEAIGLDVRWNKSEISRDGEVILQVGLSTALAHDRDELRPLNISLVIDKSGSMAAADKLSRVKSALLKFVSQLRPTDILSIVVFDSSAQVLFPSNLAKDSEGIKSLISGIEPGSATNINDGLVLGYKEALKHYRKDWTNRVILLTDGIANQGETEPKRIAQSSLGYNDRGIDLSTIGVGLDLNKDLLKTLAKSGRGLYHFVADAEDIDKVFVNELQSLISPVATEPSLEIEFGRDLELAKVYGYEPKHSGNTVRLNLDNLNSGATEVVLLRFKPAPGLSGSAMTVNVKLNYFDLSLNRKVTTTQKTSLTLGESEAAQEDSSVTKNYTIALLAQSIHDMAAECEAKRFQKAENLLNISIGKTTRRYPNLEDEDILRTLTIAQKYQAVLREQNGTKDFREEEGEERVSSAKSANIVVNGDFSFGNTGFVSDREYIKPSPQCLWGAYYTVTDRFDSPMLLHSNVPARPFSAPGGGKVLFMNSGMTDQFTVWSSKVRCKPHTKYRFSFNEIGLSGGRDWINSYEIRINGGRSEAQMGGDGTYVEIDYEWDSGTARSATVSIVRIPRSHPGGIIGVCNITMVPFINRSVAHRTLHSAFQALT